MKVKCDSYDKFFSFYIWGSLSLDLVAGPTRAGLGINVNYRTFKKEKGVSVFQDSYNFFNGADIDSHSRQAINIRKSNSK